MTKKELKKKDDKLELKIKEIFVKDEELKRVFRKCRELEERIEDIASWDLDA